MLIYVVSPKADHQQRALKYGDFYNSLDEAKDKAVRLARENATSMTVYKVDIEKVGQAITSTTVNYRDLEE